jgi:quercetin dioxygenase-like cupin family protein
MKLYKQSDRTTYVDERGIIDLLLPEGVTIKNALYITGKPGAVRGSHYHTNDTHYCVCIGGKIEYTWKSGKEEGTVVLESGDMVFTPQEEKHKFTFLTDGIFIALATESRASKDYEKDTIRVEM